MDDADLGGSIMADAGLGDSIDDLFGEAVGLDEALPPVLLPPAVALQITEMQRSGCCTKLAWSNAGSIAQISRDGSRISFRTLIRDQKLGKWVLSKESPYPVEAPPGRHFVHIQFSAIGIEMAAVDNLGCVHLFVLAGTLGRMQVAHSDIIDLETTTDVDAVAGMHWLSLRSKNGNGVYHVDPANKMNGTWVASVRILDPLRVQHPDGRNALFYVTRLGRLFLLFQNENGVWQSISHDLEICSSTEELISHAALGEYNDHLLLATHDESTRLRLFKITVLWNPSPNPRGGILVAPTLEVGHLATEESVSPKHSDSARLTHLRILPPPPPPPNQQEPLPPDVLAVFTHVSSSDATHAQQNGFNVIARWNVQHVSRHLHECFTRPRANGGNSHNDQTTVLTRATDMITNKVIIALDTQSCNTLVAFAASDGSVDFHNRANYIKILPFGDTSIVTNLAASGFEHTPDEHRPQIAMSADGCIIVSAAADGKIEAKPLTNKYGWQSQGDELSDTVSLFEASIVCLAKQYNALSYTNASSDEPLAVLPAKLGSTMRTFLIKQMLNMIGNRPGPGPDISMLDASKQQMTVLRDQSIARALSAQLALGTRPNSNERTFQGQFAYIVLNLRTLGLSLAQIFGKNPDMDRSDLAPSLVGIVRWVCGLMIWLVSSILEATRNTPSGASMVESLQQFVTDSDNPAIHLLLCSYSRILLRFHVMHIQAFMRLATAKLPLCQSVSDRQQLVDVLELATKLMPFQLKAFQDLVTDFDSSVRKTYTEAFTAPEKRMDNELRMITEGYIPSDLSAPLDALVKSQLPSMCENVDMGRLFFWDTTWLNITHVTPPPGLKCYDVIRKYPLTPGMNLRVCRRCGSQMEDITSEQLKTMPTWLGHSTRACICFNFWWLA